MRNPVQWRLAASMMVLAACTASAAVAQEAPDGQTVEEVVVVGRYAGSLKKAMEVKRDSPIVVEALSVSDLGQLPDVSVADALARLPGLAADRDPNNGAASQISLRGMPPEMSLGTLNGRDLATPTADRNIRYDQFPSELVGGAMIYKSAMASINDGGVAGSIDLRTVRPLDYKANSLQVSGSGVYAPFSKNTGLGDSSGYRGSIAYIGKFKDDTLGVAIGYAQREEPFTAVRSQHSSFNPTTYQDLGGDGRNDLVTYGLAHFVRVGTDKRRGAVAALEWKPTSDLHLYVDALYSKVDIDGKINGFYFDNTSILYANTYSNSVVQDDKLVAGTITNSLGAAGLRLSNQSAFAARNDELKSIGANLVWQVSDNSKLTADLAYSAVDYLANYAEIRTDVSSANASVAFDARGKVVSIKPSVDLTNLAQNPVTSLTMPFYQDGSDKIASGKLDFEHQFAPDGFFQSFSAGLRYVDRDKSNLQMSDSRSITPRALQADMLEPFAREGYSGKQSDQPRFLTFDFNRVVNAYFGGLRPTQGIADRVSSWAVGEQTFAGYAQVDFATDLAGMRLLGNGGLRVVRTESRSSSERLVDPGNGNTVLQPYSVSNSYTEVLPSLNFTLKPNDQWVFRLGLAKTIARAPLESLNAGFQAYDYGTPQAFGGNPLLEPFRANQVDLTAEWYFGENDFVSATAYYKDLDTFITTATQIIDIGGVNYEFFQPVNGKGGYIRGLEMTYQHQFNSLPAPFDGLGVYANYAITDSDITVSRNYSAATLGLNGLSKRVGTGSVYYYKNGFEARFSYRYRGAFARVVDGGGFENNESEGFLDFQTSYEFKNGVSVVLQAANLTNTPYKTNLGDKGLHGRYEEFGRMYYLGFRARF